MKPLTIIFTLLCLFASCDILCPEKKNQITILKTALDQAKDSLEAYRCDLGAYKSRYNDLESQFDMMDTELASCQFKLAICRATESYQGNTIEQQEDSTLNAGLDIIFNQKQK